MGRPSDLAFDAAGNLYISESSNAVIRKVSTNGIISTFAGTGTIGYNGDGLLATTTQLSNPFGLVFDNLGNLFFSDNGNRRVRKINSSLTVSTVAGTGVGGYSGDGFPATDATIRLPGYLTIGPGGDLYIPDYVNHVIRKVDATGIITTVAGNGISGNGGDGTTATSATLTSPFAVIFDSDGNMLISDRVVAVIRKVNAVGIISTIAGIGTVGYGGDGGNAVAAQFNTDVNCSAIDASGNLYLADPNNHRIRRITYNNVSVNEQSKTQPSITLHPNPACNEVTLTTTESIETVSILNTIGQIVLTPAIPSGKTEIDLNIAALPAGVYVVRVNGAYGGRFVKE